MYKVQRLYVVNNNPTYKIYNKLQKLKILKKLSKTN